MRLEGGNGRRRMDPQRLHFGIFRHADLHLEAPECRLSPEAPGVVLEVHVLVLLSRASTGVWSIAVTELETVEKVLTGLGKLLATSENFRRSSSRARWGHMAHNARYFSASNVPPAWDDRVDCFICGCLKYNLRLLAFAD